MMTFHEYAAWRKKTTLPDPVTMLMRAGISKDVPHEIDVMRFVKDEKRRTAQAPTKNAPGIAPSSLPQGRGWTSA